MENLEATRYIKHRLILSGDKYELWSYEHPVRADKIDKANIFVKGEGSGEKLDKNLLRAQMTVRQLIWCNLTSYTKVLTLTFAECNLDIDDMRYKIKQFLKQMKRCGYDLNYIWVPEHQIERGRKEGNAGSLHAHFVLFNDEKIPISVLRKCWKWGSFDIEIANGCKQSDLTKINSLSAYLSKYITKQTVSKFGCWSFVTSRNLKRPTVIDFDCYRYIDNMGNIVWTDDGKHNIYQYLKDYKTTWVSGYNYSFPIDGIEHTNSVLYKQGDLIDRL